MFKEKTVFVVGAGASAEVDMPVGSQLADAISEAMYFEFEFGRLSRGDDFTLSAWRQHFNEIDIVNEHLAAARKIHDGLFLANSIDNYLHTHQDDPRVQFCGKFAIARTILAAERNSRLYVDQPGRDDALRVKDFEGTWYVEFAKILMDGRRKTEIGDLFKGIAIVCFNYDRCIEFFLTHAIRSLYGIPLEEAEEIIGTLEIYHPYGSLGPLATRKNPNGLRFGAEIDGEKALKIAENIRTFNEEVEDQDQLKKIAAAMSNARYLVFLGFGFHRQNMRLITADPKPQVARTICTAKGISDDDCDEVRQRVGGLISSRASKGNVRVLNTATCCDLFRQFRMSL